MESLNESLFVFVFVDTNIVIYQVIPLNCVFPLFFKIIDIGPSLEPALVLYNVVNRAPRYREEVTQSSIRRKTQAISYPVT